MNYEFGSNYYDQFDKLKFDPRFTQIAQDNMNRDYNERIRQETDRLIAWVDANKTALEAAKIFIDAAPNKNIPCIKLIRLVFGLGLKEAKDIVDWVRDGKPINTVPPKPLPF